VGLDFPPCPRHAGRRAPGVVVEAPGGLLEAAAAAAAVATTARGVVAATAAAAAAAPAAAAATAEADGPAGRWRRWVGSAPRVRASLVGSRAAAAGPAQRAAGPPHEKLGAGGAAPSPSPKGGALRAKGLGVVIV
jgi:hypothetical protein